MVNTIRRLNDFLCVCVCCRNGCFVCRWVFRQVQALDVLDYHFFFTRHYNCLGNFLPSLDYIFFFFGFVCFLAQIFNIKLEKYCI